jgi:hypothetical protein
MSCFAQRYTFSPFMYFAAMMAISGGFKFCLKIFECTSHLDSQSYGKKFLCVQRDLQYSDITSHHVFEI